MPLEIRTSRLPYAIFLVLIAFSAADGIYIIRVGGPTWIGWMRIAPLALIPLFVWQLVDTRPILVIDDAGVLVKTLGVGRIPWEEITGAHKRGGTCVCLDLIDAEKYVSKLNAVRRVTIKMNVKFGYSPILVNLLGTKNNPDQVIELILKMVEMKGGKGKGWGIKPW